MGIRQFNTRDRERRDYIHATCALRATMMNRDDPLSQKPKGPPRRSPNKNRRKN